MYKLLVVYLSSVGIFSSGPFDFVLVISSCTQSRLLGIAWDLGRVLCEDCVLRSAKQSVLDKTSSVYFSRRSKSFFLVKKLLIFV